MREWNPLIYREYINTLNKGCSKLFEQIQVYNDFLIVQYTYTNFKTFIWLVVVYPPLWKIWVRQLGWGQQPNISGKIKLMATKPPSSYFLFVTATGPSTSKSAHGDDDGCRAQSAHVFDLILTCWDARLIGFVTINVMMMLMYIYIYITINIYI